MKLTLALVLLMNLQFIHAYNGFIFPFIQPTAYQPLSPVVSPRMDYYQYPIGKFPCN